MRYKLTRILKEVRNKLQWETLLKGMALFSAIFLAGLLFLSLALSHQNFSDDAVFWARIGAGLALVFILLRYLVLPLWRRPSPRQVARFLEERHPELQERLSTAVEVSSEDSRVHPEIRQLILDDAAREISTISRPGLYHPRMSLASALTLLITLVISAYLFYGGPELFRYTFNKLTWSWADKDQRPLYWIQVTPGNTTVGKRSDVDIRAILKGFNSEKVHIVARYQSDPQWQEVDMKPSGKDSAFVFEFFDVRERIDYYVEADGIRSTPFVINVSQIPRVEKLSTTLQFPDYTGLQDVTRENGDVRALEGTRVHLQVETDQAVKAGSIKLEEGGEIALKLVRPNRLTGTFEVRRNDYYRIHLQDQQGFWNPGSDEFIVEALKDQPPTIKFTRPGRDSRVTNIEEVYTELRAEDDYGVRKLMLKYSVNGDKEQQIVLPRSKNNRSVTGSHTFYLEDFNLKPGDFVSYYGQASDAVNSSTTDIYFLQVQPYEKEYFQSQQNGQAGAAGANQPLRLSAQQKEIVIATFKLTREVDRADDSQFKENSQTLALVQQRLQKEAQTIIDRIERRGAALSDQRFAKMVSYLKEAVTHMVPSHKHLNELHPSQALPEEQKALQQLLRAEAMFNEIQVAFGQSPAGSGPSPEELADLMDLELDKTKNQYETLQQNQQAQRDQQLDEALEKLKELARRQEQQVERRRRGMQSSSGGGGSFNQADLIDQVEQLARQLERLSRHQQNSNRLSDISRRLRQAARDLRRSQASGSNSQQAQMNAERALQQLQQAREALARQRRESISNGLQQLQEGSRKLARQQQEVIDRVKGLQQRSQSAPVNKEFFRDLRKVLDEKSGMEQDLRRLESGLHQTARQLESENPEAAKKLKQAGLNIRDQRIPEKMQEGSQLLSRGWTDLARQREEGIGESLQKLAQMIEQAAQTKGKGNSGNSRDQMKEALARAGNLVENLQSLKERVEQAKAEGRPSDSQSQLRGQKPGEGSSARESSQNQSGQTSGREPDSAGKERAASSANSGTATSSSRRNDGTPAWGPGRPAPSGQIQGGTRSRSRLDPEQVQREWRERLKDARELRSLLGNDPRLRRGTDDLIRQMRQLDLKRILSDEKQLALLRSKVIEGFQQLELEINRALREDSGQLLQLSGEDQVPPEFRKQVEEYYRALSRKAKKKNRP